MILESIMIGKIRMGIFVHLRYHLQANKFIHHVLAHTYTHACSGYSRIRTTGVHVSIHLLPHTDKYLLFVVPASGSVVSTAAVNTGGAIALTRGTDVSQRDR